MKALIWPVFPYGAESWGIVRRTVRESVLISDANRIRSFEMWFRRKMIDGRIVERKSHSITVTLPKHTNGYYTMAVGNNGFYKLNFFYLNTSYMV